MPQRMPSSSILHVEVCEFICLVKIIENGFGGVTVAGFRSRWRPLSKWLLIWGGAMWGKDGGDGLWGLGKSSSSQCPGWTRYWEPWK
jgi:hypothetical protein